MKPVNTMNIKEISSNLELSDSGIWFSSSTRAISYPKENNAICFGIEDDSFWYAHRNKCIYKVVKHYSTRAPIFDMGGGNGVVSQELGKLGIETYLVEPGLAGIMNAQNRGLPHLICATFEDCGFYDNVLPAIGLFDLLEHIEQDMDFLRKIHNVLVKNGTLFITVPAYNFLWSNHDTQVGHLRRYTVHRLCRRLEQLDYHVEYATYLFGLLPIPIWLSRTLPGKLGLYKNVTPKLKRKEHQAHRAEFVSFITWFLEKELTRIQSRKSLRFGSSCLVVARKI